MGGAHLFAMGTGRGTEVQISRTMVFRQSMIDHMFLCSVRVSCGIGIDKDLSSVFLVREELLGHR